MIKPLTPVHLRQLSKVYRGGKIALQDITASIGFGLHGLLGENGAGKTTLLSILATLTEPTSGTASIFGLDAVRDRSEIRGQLGLVPQDLGLYRHLTCREFLEYMACLKAITDLRVRRRQIEEALQAVNLTDQADRKTEQLSGGMKRRLGIAQALLGQPRLLIVDEPTVGLDPVERMRLRMLLADLSPNRVILFSTHIIEDIASSCDRVLILHKGRCLYNGAVADAIRRAKGRIWTCSLEPVGFQQLSLKHTVIGCMRLEDRLVARFVSPQGDPGLGAIPAEPTLEDAYLLELSQSGA